MSFFNLFNSKPKPNNKTSANSYSLNSPNAFVDSSTISNDERPYYQADSYYTYYSYPGTPMAVRVIPFEERKKSTFPSARGLYVAEIMLLEYCKAGNYPKPQKGYPGFWWFKYGIRDVGHALESLVQRGFIKWASKASCLNGLKTDELKQILEKSNLSTAGKKADLISRISSNIPENTLVIPNYTPKYELTELGRIELEENGYIPYMHKHKHLTTEDSRFGETFTVWDINKLFPNGDARNWRKVVGDIELRRFGVDMANAGREPSQSDAHKTIDPKVTRDEMRTFLSKKQKEITKGIQTSGDGFAEEALGLDYKSIGQDKEALVQFYIAIGKRFDAPALYRETASLLQKYALYEEAISVLDVGLEIISKNSQHWLELQKRKRKIQELKDKNS